MSHPKSDAVVYHHPKDLRVLKDIKHLPELEDDDPQFEALCDAVLRGDPVPPIWITEDKEVVAGRHRRRAFLRAQQDVPCVIVPRERALFLAIAENSNRSQHAKFQLAFLYAPLAIKVIGNAAARRLKNLTNGHAAPDSAIMQSLPLKGSSDPSTMEELAAAVGIAARTLHEAKATYELAMEVDEKRKGEPMEWAEYPVAPLTCLEYFTRRVLASTEAKVLGHLRAGIMGKRETDGKERRVRSASVMVIAPVITITNQISALGPIKQMEPDARKAFRKDLVDSFIIERSWNEAQCQKAAKSMRELAGEFDRLAKQAGGTEEEA